MVVPCDVNCVLTDYTRFGANQLQFWCQEISHPRQTQTEYFNSYLHPLPQDVRPVFEVNYFGVISVTQKFLPLLRQTGDGARIVQISSLAGLISGPAGNPYCASKFALEALNHALRVEMAPWKIAVSAVNPAFTKSDIFDKHDQHIKARLANVPPEKMKLYANYYSEARMQKQEEVVAKADDPQVTTDAIEHAVISPRPQVRYVCANADGIPASVIAWLWWLIPERLGDALLLSSLQ